MKYISWLILICFVSSFRLSAQAPTCPYPVILLHGWTGSNESWADFYQDISVEQIFGVFDENDQVFWAMPNAFDTHDYYIDCCWWDPFCIVDCEYVVDSTRNDDIRGPDGIFNNNATGDDVQWVFPNENNSLVSGCLYAYSFNVGKNTDGTIFKNPTLTSTAPCDECSDNNEAAAYKQGYALKRVIEAVLLANPDKDRVILMAHSMGGLCAREYLQRRNQTGNPQWWVDAAQPDGHKVAKLITLGTPHRGSNTFGNLTSLINHNRNDLPDLQSEGIRDLRYSYEDGTTGNDIPGVYLYGGLESDISDFLFSYWSKDVNCDGDKEDIITGINIDGTDQGYSEVWDGTRDNSLMPLPNNIKYTYYVSDADGVVDETRQWLYLGGTGSTIDFNSGLSVPVPHDGIDHRRSDRINVSRFHLNHTDDIPNVVRALDEPDYPIMSYELHEDLWYFGLPQKRADQVPQTSEFTLTGNNLIDGDWYKFGLIDTAYQFQFELLPSTGMDGRIDIYFSLPDSFSNSANADTTVEWFAGADSILISTDINNYIDEYVHVRITHDISSFAGPITDAWKNPYYFRMECVKPCTDSLFVSGIQVNTAYRVSQKIYADALVPDSTNLHLEAGTYIELRPGFEIGQHAQFQAKIDSCSTQ